MGQDPCGFGVRHGHRGLRVENTLKFREPLDLGSAMGSPFCETHGKVRGGPRHRSTCSSG